MTAPPRRRFEARWLPGLGWGVFDIHHRGWATPCSPDRSQHEAGLEADERERQALCQGKRRFVKKLAAAEASRLRRELGEPIVAYHCHLHHCYHVGHPTGWRAKNARPRVPLTEPLPASVPADAPSPVGVAPLPPESVDDHTGADMPTDPHATTVVTCDRGHTFEDLTAAVEETGGWCPTCDAPAHLDDAERQVGLMNDLAAHGTLDVSSLRWERRNVAHVARSLNDEAPVGAEGRFGMLGDIVTVLLAGDQLVGLVTEPVAWDPQRPSWYRCNLCGRRGCRNVSEKSSRILAAHVIGAHGDPASMADDPPVVTPVG